MTMSIWPPQHTMPGQVQSANMAAFRHTRKLRNMCAGLISCTGAIAWPEVEPPRYGFNEVRTYSGGCTVIGVTNVDVTNFATTVSGVISADTTHPRRFN